MQIYGDPPVFTDLDWPLNAHEMARTDRAYQVMFGHFEAAKVPVICHIVDYINRGIVKNKDYKQFAFDLQEVVFR